MLGCKSDCIWINLWVCEAYQSLEKMLTIKVKGCPDDEQVCAPSTIVQSEMD